MNADEVGLGRVFPAILILFCITATALVETGVADLIAIGQHLSAGFEDGLFDMGTGGLGDTLIALAVVVGTDIEDGVILAVVPADEFIVLSREREEAIGTLLMLLALGHLGEEPRTRDDRMGLEELGGRGGRHLAGDDAGQVALYGQVVDGHNLIGLDHDAKRALEGLRLLALPVEVDTNGDIFQRERGTHALWTEGEVTIERATPQDAALGELYRLLAHNLLAFGDVGAVEREGYLLTRDDAHRDEWLFGVGR